MKTKYTKAAQKDIEEIFLYIAPRSDVSVADKLVDAIVGTCEFLADYPFLGRRRPEFDDFGFEVRSITERGYLIVYTTFEGTIFIVRVMHGAMDIDRTDFRGLSNIGTSN